MFYKFTNKNMISGPVLKLIQSKIKSKAILRKKYFHENIMVSTEHSGKLLKPQLQKRMKIDDILVPLSHLFREF